MSDKKVIKLNAIGKQIAKQCIDQSSEDYFCIIQKKTRSLEQNSRLWALLTEVSDQVEWYGRKLTPEEWKHVFSAALSKQDVVPGLDGGFVVLGQSTSRMAIKEMCDLQELICAFGAERGVKFKETRYEDYHLKPVEFVA